ncbi:MAG: DUF4292 domain-containing protein [Candidatus Kapaibacterium sp.]|jgi:hypothetical protein|nr:DUF4292 domain-containing protein [Candidatus Kapabacteria bacterium]
MKVKRYLKIIIGVMIITIVISSCSSIKSGEKGTATPVLKELNSSLYRLNADCLINTNMNGQSFSFNARLNIAGTDTVSMVVSGPFGITVGRLYADLNYFRFHNVMENTVYEGTPSQENIKRATNMSISIRDLLALFQGKTPFVIKEYSLVEEKNETAIIKRVDKSNFGDFGVLDIKDYKLLQYQRKDSGDILMLNSSFDRFKAAGSGQIPTSLNFLMPLVDGRMIIEIENFKINDKAAPPEKFAIPSSVKIINLDNY